MFWHFIFVVLFFSVNLFGMEATKVQPFEFSVMTYNVCNFYGMANSLEASHITWEKRKERILPAQLSVFTPPVSRYTGLGWGWWQEQEGRDRKRELEGKRWQVTGGLGRDRGQASGEPG